MARVVHSRKTTDDFVDRITGPVDTYDLKLRLFNGITFFSAIATAVVFFNDLLQNRSFQYWLYSSTLTLFFAVCYLLGRRRKAGSRLYATLIFVYLLTAAYVWFFLAGFFGPFLVYIMVVAILIAFLLEGGRRLFATAAMLAMVATLAFIQIEYPGLVRIRTERVIRVIDYAIRLLLASGFSVVLLTTISRSYSKEREKVELVNQGLSALNVNKDKFVSIIAHDLRNPISGISTITRSMLERIQDLSEEEAKQYLEVAVNAADRTENLLENLLLWARSESGNIPFEPVPILLSAQADNTIELLGQAAQQKSISIANTIPSSLIASADENMLSLIFRNLITNAIKFTEEGGHIEIGAVAERGGFLSVYVKDDGIGMEAEIAGKLFDLAAKVSKRGTAGEKGSGLGLKLCAQFVHRHGGGIRAESRPGAGSTFRFTLPEADSAPL